MGDCDARPLARRLLAVGVPVVVVRNGETPPPGWQHLTAAECDLSSYRPGRDALALVGGHGIDLVDEDTKDGGSADNLPPFRRYGVTRTPTGGRHLVVPSSGLGKISPLTTEAGHVGDYVGGRPDGSGRLLGFLPGSVRSKPEHGGRPYVEEEPWDVEECVRSSSDPALVQALARCGGRRAAREQYLDDSPTRDPALGVHPYAAAAVAGELDRLRECSRLGWDGPGWDNTTFEVACNLQEIANSGWSGYTEEQALRDLLDHAPTDAAWGEREHLAKWASALNTVDGGGRREPARATAAEDFAVERGAGPPADEAAGGWDPIDLTATVAGLLDGTVTRPEPTVGDFGGGCLFYAGRINSVHGDSTAGKTWTALVTAAQELEAGNTVAYVDLEDSAAGVVSRLVLDLGVDADAVAARLLYLHPDDRLTPAAAEGLARLLEAQRPSLVVVDSTGEALAVEGANPNADEVARWFRQLPRLAVRCGAAVLLLDHATKAGDNDLWPIGSQRKRAAVTGAAYLQKVVVPFGKEQDGKAVLLCAKDRHGNYPLRRRVAALQVRGGCISLGDEGGGAGAEFRPTGTMERVSRQLEGVTLPMSGRDVTAAVTGKKAVVAAALDALVREGYVRREAGPRNSQLHVSVRPYREAADQGLL
ncbi:MAG: AAA family ATPase [Marmoricola sp.]